MEKKETCFNVVKHHFAIAAEEEEKIYLPQLKERKKLKPES